HTAPSLRVLPGEVDAVERGDRSVTNHALLDLEHQNSPTDPTRKRSMARIVDAGMGIRRTMASLASAVMSTRITLADIAAPKFKGPACPSRRKMSTGTVGDVGRTMKRV